jgi:hypothetical protein
MQKTIKLQVPLKQELKEIGEMLAQQEGLSSYQELIRYWTMQAYQGKLYINGNPEIIAEKARKYKAEADEIYSSYKKGDLQGFSNANELIDDLDKHANTEKTDQLS